MGVDERVVVDERLWVKGLSGFWIVDVLIMLSIILGNMNVLVIMIGEKVVYMILEDVQRELCMYIIEVIKGCYFV